MNANSGALEALRSVQDGWNRAMATWDVDAVAKLYDPEAQIFGSKPGLYLGPEGARRYYGRFGVERCVAHFENQAVFSPDPMLVIGSGPVTFHMTAGGVAKILDFRFSFVLRFAGRWGIFLHHESPAPPLGWRPAVRDCDR
jgi:hypothetical protein